MRNPKRKTAFVLAATEHRTVIVNRFDYRIVDRQDGGIGVGFQLLEQAMFDPGEVDMRLAQHMTRGSIPPSKGTVQAALLARGAKGERPLPMETGNFLSL